MRTHAPARTLARFLVVASALAPVGLHGGSALAQGIVVDQGSFSVRVDGGTTGTEDFSIRRAGIGRDDALFATGVVVLATPRARTRIEPLLRADPPEGILAGYQVAVTGPESLDLQMTRAGRRYVAAVQSALGQEDREFPARETTRLLERGVAHQYYFLRNARPGERIHVIEPRSRLQTTLTVASSADEEIQLAGRTVSARRVELEVDGESAARRVWFDRLGRVLRVEVPDRGYVAERTDLVG